MSRNPRPLLAIALGAAMLLPSGCALNRVVQPNPDSMATWSDRPLAPDPNLTALALGSGSSCTADPNGGPFRVLLQDRRTPQTAAFLIASPKSFGSCFVTGGGGSSGGSGPVLGAMAGRLTIDDISFGSAGNGQVRQLGGRVAPGASRVVIELEDGRSVLASLGNGFWLAWWPDTTLGRRVVANDATGTEIATAEVPT